MKARFRAATVYMLGSSEGVKTWDIHMTVPRIGQLETGDNIRGRRGLLNTYLGRDPGCRGLGV